MYVIKIEWSKYFYKRMKLYTLAVMFGLICLIAPIINIRILLGFISIGFWVLGVTYGRYWELNPE